jgi:transcriptional regulator with XRE-family HTH domain
MKSASKVPPGVGSSAVSDVTDGCDPGIAQSGDLDFREAAVLQVFDPLFPCDHGGQHTDFRKESNGYPFRKSVVIGSMKQPIPYTELDKRLSVLRAASGKTLGEVAKATGLTPGTLSDLEHDRHRGSKKLHALAEYYKVQYTWLETGKGPKELEKPAIEGSIQHGYFCTPDGARIGAEWQKIEGDEYRQLVHDFVFGMVAAQERAGRRSLAKATETRPEAKTSITPSTRPSTRVQQPSRERPMDSTRPPGRKNS